MNLLDKKLVSSIKVLATNLIQETFSFKKYGDRILLCFYSVGN